MYEREEKWKTASQFPLVRPQGRMNQPPVPIGSQTQPSEPIRDKNRINSLALKRAVFAGLGENRG
jgi:hypothetical protein